MRRPAPPSSTPSSAPSSAASSVVTAVAAAAVLVALAGFGNPAAAELTADERAQLEQMRDGDMKKLVIHDAPKAAVDAVFVNPNGGRATVEDFAGAVTVVNLWATWCPPCIKEMPALDRLRQALADDPRVDVVTVNTERRGRIKAKAFLEDNLLYALEPWSDERNALPRAIGVLGLPTTVILDPQGREIARLQGDAVWDAPEAEAILRRLADFAGDES
ncbi:MAG: TlpA disulfide reductase family protein [Pseudomonadota bacterium]